MTYKFLSHPMLASLVADLLAAKTRVIAPVRAKDDPAQIDYQPLERLEDAAFGVRLPRRSLKEFFLQGIRQGLQLGISSGLFHSRKGCRAGNTPKPGAAMHILFTVTPTRAWGARSEREE